MLAIWRRGLRNIVTGTFSGIIAALIIAALIAFFGGLILRVSLPEFGELTRNIYIVLWLVNTGWTILSATVATVFILTISTRFHVSIQDVIDAISIGMLKQKPAWQWDRVWFVETLESHRQLSESLTKFALSLFPSFRSRL